MSETIISDLQDTLEQFKAYFPPNPFKHGLVTLWTDRDTGELKKKAETLEGKPVEDDLLTWHLGEKARGKTKAGYIIGYLPAVSEFETTVGAVDLDGKDYPEPGALENAKHTLSRTLDALEVAYCWERSVRGNGWHCWIFSSAALPIITMRAALRACVARAGFKASTETFPKGEDARSSWIQSPYAQALRSDNGLGHTHLETWDEQPIPLTDLGEYITRTPVETLLELSQTPHDALQTLSSAADALDLHPDALPLLLEVLKQKAPHPRHDTAPAFLNLGRRCGQLEAMTQALKDVFDLWVTDGSRTKQQWADEIERWAEHIRVKGAGGRGIPYLKAQGFLFPRLPRLAQLEGVTGTDGPRLSRPEIVITGRFLREIADDAIDALEAANTPPMLFKRGGELVRVALEEGQVRAKPLDAVALKGTLDRCADFITEKTVTETERDEKGKPKRGADGKAITHSSTENAPARPPADLAPDLLARVDRLPFPTLRTLATSPIYSASGEQVSTPGFHFSSGIYLELGTLEVPDLPSVSEALSLLGEMLQDFPFIHKEAGFAHTLAALLLHFSRPLIDGPTPLHLIEAPTRGSGKGLLCEVISYVSLGRAAGTMVKPKDGDEFEKRVTSALLEGAAVMLLDNVHTLEGEALAAALTARVWRGRRLGKSEMLTLPNDALWLATGNNVNLDDDMPRRIIPIRLDPQVERPEDRTDFLHADLLGWVKARRGELVAACLSLIQAWLEAGRPAGSVRLGSYESWAATMGGILEHAGVKGFLTGREHLYETANAEPQEWAAVLAEVYRVHKDEPVTAREVLSAMKNSGNLGELWEGRRELSALQRIGHALRQKRDRVFSGLALRLAGESKNQNKAYRVVLVSGGPKKTPETPETPEAQAKTPTDTANAQEGVLGKTPPQTPERTPENTLNTRGGVLNQNTPPSTKTPVKHPPHLGSLESVSDNVFIIGQGVSGVSGVFSGLTPTVESELEGVMEI